MSSGASNNFYRRPLPESCIDFSSTLGKQLFTEALLEGNANIYFKLASQFRTQDEPAFCGLSTLVMVLNALEVDPEKVWKAPWRFYHESMLDCCVPLVNIKRSGINLSQFSCLATCNRLKAEVQYGTSDNEFLKMMRDKVIKSVRSERKILVASYDRSVLGQTGSGHFSPLAAYHQKTDKVLIMDVARFKYPPHWIDLELLQKSMCTIDKSTKKQRGYVCLELRSETRPLIMYGLKAYANVNDADFASSVISWKEFLLCDPLKSDDEEFKLCCLKFSQLFASNAVCCSQKIVESGQREAPPDFSNRQNEVCRTICEEVRKTAFSELISSSSVAALLIAWPFEPNYSERSDRIQRMSIMYREQFTKETKNEIDQLTIQIKTLICCSKPPVVLNNTVISKCNTSKIDDACACLKDIKL